MASKRLLLSVTALVLALVAGLATFTYLRGVQKRAYHNASLVKVYTVSAPIARGTSGTAVIGGNVLKQGQIPAQYLPSDAVTDLATIRNEVASANLAPGQILESDLFVAPASTVSSSATAQAIPKGDVAISISVDSVRGVAGLIRPGDLIDILAQVTPGNEQFLYQNVNVLAVGTTVVQSGVVTTQTANAGSTSGSGLLTLAVPADAALRIALAENSSVSGSIYLALVPPGNQASAQTPISQSNLIPANLTPS